MTKGGPGRAQALAVLATVIEILSYSNRTVYQSIKAIRLFAANLSSLATPLVK